MYQYRSLYITIFFESENIYEKSCGSLFFFYIEAASPEKPEKRGLSCSRALEVPPKRVSKSICWSKLVPNWLRCCVSQLTPKLKLFLHGLKRPATFRTGTGTLEWLFGARGVTLDCPPWSFRGVWSNFGPISPTSAFWYSFWGHFPGSAATKTSFFGSSPPSPGRSSCPPVKKTDGPCQKYFRRLYSSVSGR